MRCSRERREQRLKTCGQNVNKNPLTGRRRGADEAGEEEEVRSWTATVERQGWGGGWGGHSPMAWARAMTTSWQDVSSDRPQTTRTTPSTHTLSSIRDQAAAGGRWGAKKKKKVGSSTGQATLHGTDSERGAEDTLVGGGTGGRRQRESTPKHNRDVIERHRAKSGPYHTRPWAVLHVVLK